MNDSGLTGCLHVGNAYTSIFISLHITQVQMNQRPHYKSIHT